MATDRPRLPNLGPLARRARLACACALLAGLILALLMAVFPMGASLAAASPDTVDDTAGVSVPGAASTTAASNFGAAMPSDRFIQSFQQQLSQQLQSAISQANETQESRLRGFEDEQKELGAQIQALKQSIDAGNAQGGARAAAGARPEEPPADALDAEPPRVNVRRPASADVTEADVGITTGSAAGTGAAPLASILGGMGGMGGAAVLGDPALAFDALHAGGAPDEGSGLRGTTARARGSRAGDANISPHGFVEGRLLNGVVAVVGGPDRESVVALSGNYQSANGFLADLDGCFALVQGKPEIAAGRIDFKLSRLTCNFADGASRTWDTAGWLVDADGIRGVRAVIVENAGRKAAVAAAGGAIGGVGQRLSQQQYQIDSINNGVGVGTSSTFIGSAGRDALGGAASGAANALGAAINDYYNLYTPSLQVGGGTPVTVVLANDLRVPASGRDITATHTSAP
jgi:conjugal transfer pilus assembly protein TraB